MNQKSGGGFSIRASDPDELQVIRWTTSSELRKPPPRMVVVGDLNCWELWWIAGQNNGRRASRTGVIYVFPAVLNGALNGDEEIARLDMT